MTETAAGAFQSGDDNLEFFSAGEYSQPGDTAGAAMLASRAVAPSCRYSPGAGIVGAAVMAVASIVITLAAVRNNASLQLDASTKIAAVVVASFSMLAWEVYFRKVYRQNFDFSSPRPFTFHSLKRLWQRYLGVSIALVGASGALLFLSLYQFETVAVFALVVPGYVLISFFYFLVVELYARPNCAVDEFLYLGQAVTRLLAASFGRKSLSDAINALKDEQVGNLLRTMWIKTHFGSLMLFYAITSSVFLEKSVREVLGLASGHADLAAFYPPLQNSVIQLLLTADTTVALVGYVSSCRLLDNHTYATESSVPGVCYTLVCYHPFNLLMQVAVFGTLGYCWPAQWLRSAPFVAYPAMLAVICLFCVYVSSTLCFGARFSNLSYRGLVNCGIYKIIRHPSYASKNLAWWICVLPLIYAGAVSGDWMRAVIILASMGAITFVYVMRGLTEERFLSKDPAYREYCKQVRYRFIPGVI